MRYITRKLAVGVSEVLVLSENLVIIYVQESSDHGNVFLDDTIFLKIRKLLKFNSITCKNIIKEAKRYKSGNIILTGCGRLYRKNFTGYDCLSAYENGCMVTTYKSIFASNKEYLDEDTFNKVKEHCLNTIEEINSLVTGCASG